MPLMLMRPNKAETAVHGGPCLGDMASVRMRKVLSRLWVGVECVTCFYRSFSRDVITYLKSKTKDPPKFLSSSGKRGGIFISVYNFSAQ